VNDKISNMAFVNESFTAFRAQFEDLEARHRSNMKSRNEILDLIVTLQRGIQNKVITANRSPFLSPLTPPTFPRKGPLRFPEKMKISEQSRMWTRISGKFAPFPSQYAL
jgi:hypothetical protein